jgi:DNA (cytosine-5)-methyltransferase 1
MTHLDLTHLDLFSGIGGFTIAAEWAGFQTVGFAEIEPFCCRLLAERWPRIKNYGSVDNTESFRELRGSITVLSAGVPCQPASLAGKRGGEKDNRWKWPATLAITELVRPTFCLFENPPGILTLDEFGGVLLRLESFGYEVRAFSVPANSVGAKHRRQRVFVVAHAERRQRTGRNGWREEAGGRTYAKSCGTSQDAETLADAGGGRCEERSQRNGESERSKFDPSRGNDVERCGVLDFRLTESPLCRATDGIRNRSHRLKALGNSVVPQQAFPFFEAIAQVIFSRDKLLQTP